MSTHKAAGGKASQHVSPSGKRLGTKLFAGEKITPGMIIVKQRGSRVGAGRGVSIGRDHTVYAKTSGVVKFSTKLGRKIVSVV